jgi:hypothetical protein
VRIRDKPDCDLEDAFQWLVGPQVGVRLISISLNPAVGICFGPDLRAYIPVYGALSGNQHQHTESDTRRMPGSGWAIRWQAMVRRSTINN